MIRAGEDLMLCVVIEAKEIWQGTGTYLRTGVPITEKIRSHLVLDHGGDRQASRLCSFKPQDIDWPANTQFEVIKDPPRLPIAHVYTRLKNVTPALRTPNLSYSGIADPKYGDTKY